MNERPAKVVGLTMAQGGPYAARLWWAVAMAFGDTIPPRCSTARPARHGQNGGPASPSITPSYTNPKVPQGATVQRPGAATGSQRSMLSTGGSCGNLKKRTGACC